ncbi:hypothetical protein ACNJX9_37135 [Bradyrhizobium sp. DASA03076]
MSEALPMERMNAKPIVPFQIAKIVRIFVAPAAEGVVGFRFI